LLLKLNNINTIKETKKFIIDVLKAIILVCFKLEAKTEFS